jgi:hypothetical protein
MDPFQQVLDAYRTNYLQYKLTGNAANKTAYENAQTWINQHLRALNNQIQDSANYINGFVQDYSKANPEIQKYSQDLERIRNEGPKLQDHYQTAVLLSEEKTEVPDWTSYYVKAVVAAGLVGIIAAVSLV